MHVVATAGHVDHGKSTLVRALTGTDPDRLAEEQRRGLTIALGYCWTTLPEVGDVAFVDVPGHERFVPTMLAGIGPVPAVLFVVAADDPWMPQAAEHLAALDALEVSHGVVAVTRADLADPAPAATRARAALAPTSLREAPTVAVSGRTGRGLDELRAALAAMLRGLPAPDPCADVRLWVDRRFTVRGAGTVITGTLPAGRAAAGDTLEHDGVPVRVRAVQALGRPAPEVRGTARVALNVTGPGLEGLGPGSVLVTPGAWHRTETLDVRLRPRPAAADPAGRARPPAGPILHVGAAALAVHHRPLGGDVARLTLPRPLPLRVGDRALLRDPGTRALWGLTVLDPAPPPLTRRGAAARRAAALRGAPGDLAAEVARRGAGSLTLLRRIGVPVAAADQHALVAGGWFLARDRVEPLAARALDVVRTHDAAHPLEPGVPAAALAERLGLPDVALLPLVLRPPLAVRDGRVRVDSGAALPGPVEAAVAVLVRELAQAPFAAPTAERLAELGVDDRALAAAARAGRLLRPAPGIALAPGADRLAVTLLAGLDQPFTTSAARQRLGTSRRVILPLLAHLDRTGRTRRLADDRRALTGR